MKRVVAMGAVVVLIAGSVTHVPVPHRPDPQFDGPAPNMPYLPAKPAIGQAAPALVAQATTQAGAELILLPAPKNGDVPAADVWPPPSAIPSSPPVAGTAALQRRAVPAVRPLKAWTARRRPDAGPRTGPVGLTGLAAAPAPRPTAVPRAAPAPRAQ